MHHRMEVVVAGRSSAELDEVETALSHRPDIRINRKQFINGHADALQDVYPAPDAIVLVVSRNWQAELAALRERPVQLRPPLLVVGEEGNAELVRVAMRAGARDFLSPPVSGGELDHFFDQVARERNADASHHAARMTAVVNAKGGAGASTIAANMAHMMACEDQRRALLVDLDLQFGSLPLYFNLEPRNGLVRALELVDSLDAVALEGYLLKHSSGLHLLAAAPDDRMTLAEIPEDRLEMLLNILGGLYDDIVVDLPRWISGATAMALERADRVVVVMEQGVAHLRDAQQLLTVLRQDLQVSDAQLTVVINRYTKSHPVTLRDIELALPELQVLTLPNDFKRVSQTADAGSPLLEMAPSAGITRKIRTLLPHIGERSSAAASASPKWRIFNWARQP